MATQIHGAGPTGERSPGLDLAIAGYLTDNPPAGGGASTLGDLTDVDTTGATTGQVLTFDGSEWSPDAPSAGTVTSTSISDSTATGRAVLTAADAATARSAIGAGTSNLAIGTTGSTAAAGNRAASTTAIGMVELATNTETTTGTDTTRAVTPAGVKAVADTKANTSHTHGVTDLTATGTRDATTVLHGDNTWKVPAGGGGGAPVLDVSSTPALWVVAPVSSVAGSYSDTARLWTSTLMPYPMTVHGLGIFVTTADTGATLSVRLYQGFTSTDEVSSVTDPVALPLDATGYVQVALDEPVSLAHGPLFIAYTFSGTVARVRSGTNTLPFYRPGTTGVDHRQSRFIVGSGSLPASFGITTNSAPTPENPPALGLLAVAP